MDREKFITPCGPFDEPVSHFRAATLTVAMTLAALLCGFLLTVPRTTHGVSVDLPLTVLDPSPSPRSVRQLDVAADGTMSLDGVAVADLPGLQRILDRQQTEDPQPRLQVEPHPELRYGDFLQVLAVVKRAGVFPDCIRFRPVEDTSIETRRAACAGTLMPID